MPPFSLSDAIVAATRPPTVGDRRQLALLQIGVALDALKAGDYGAAVLFIRDAETHVRAMLADPRDPRPDSELRGRDPIFRHHNCSRCRSGEKACVEGDPGRCDWPHARND